jgi:hypothetical protein
MGIRHDIGLIVVVGESVGGLAELDHAAREAAWLKARLQAAGCRKIKVLVSLGPSQEAWGLSGQPATEARFKTWVTSLASQVAMDRRPSAFVAFVGRGGTRLGAPFLQLHDGELPMARIAAWLDGAIPERSITFWLGAAFAGKSAEVGAVVRTMTPAPTPLATKHGLREFDRVIGPPPDGPLLDRDPDPSWSGDAESLVGLTFGDGVEIDTTETSFRMFDIKIGGSIRGEVVITGSSASVSGTDLYAGAEHWKVDFDEIEDTQFFLLPVSGSMPADFSPYRRFAHQAFLASSTMDMPSVNGTITWFQVKRGPATGSQSNIGVTLHVVKNASGVITLTWYALPGALLSNGLIACTASQVLRFDPIESNGLPVVDDDVRKIEASGTFVA